MDALPEEDDVSLARTIGWGGFRRGRHDEDAPSGAPKLPQNDAGSDLAAVEGPAVPRPVAAHATDDPEFGMPRWRRPSLLEARRYDPSHLKPEHQSLHFGEPSGGERRVVRYRLVRMLSVPDELHGLETGCLDEGDEVEILEQQGVFRFVLAPDGGSGWVHRMTLGDLVTEPRSPAARSS